MQVSVEQISTLERKLTVTLPAEALNKQVQARLGEIKKTAKINGFRPGKVPMNIITQRYGGQVRSEVLGDVVRRGFNDAVVQEKLRPAMAPEITVERADDKDIEFLASFEVMPEIETIDVSSLKVTRPVAEVADGDIDEMLETLRQQRKAWNDVERAAKKEDLVLFESYAQVGDKRVPEEGVDRAGTVLGSGALFEDLENKLAGLKTNEEKDIQVEFPENYRVQELAGQKADMHVKLVRVAEAELPEINNEFIQSFGIASGDEAEFRTEIKANLDRELSGALMARLKQDVVDGLLNQFESLELPSKMVAREIEGMKDQMRAQAESQGVKNPELPADEALQESAHKRVKAAVLLGELARQVEIKLDESRLRQTLASIASTYEQPEQVVEVYRSNPQLMTQLQNRVIEDQLIDWIADHSDIKEEKLTFADVMKKTA